MDATEKQILRAQLLASGVIRYWQWDKSKSELERWLEVMAEELEHLNDPVALLKIRENLLRYGLRVPEVTTPVHVYNPIALQAADAIGDSSDSEVCGRLPKAYSMSSTVHSPGATALQPPQNSDTLRSRAVIESKEVKEVNDLATDEHGFNFGLTNQPCTTCGNAYSESKLPVPAQLPQLASDEVEQNAGHRTDRRLKTQLTFVDAQRGGQRQPYLNGSTGSWTWRNWSYNRVPPAIEQAVYEKFNQGWSKSKLAREFRLNRRTIIRICRCRVG